MKTRLRSLSPSLFPSSYKHPEQEALRSTLFPLQEATPASQLSPCAVLLEKLGLHSLLLQEPAFQLSARTGSKQPSLENSSRLLPKATAFRQRSSRVTLRCDSFPSTQENGLVLTEVLERGCSSC